GSSPAALGCCCRLFLRSPWGSYSAPLTTKNELRKQRSRRHRLQQQRMIRNRQASPPRLLKARVLPNPKKRPRHRRLLRLPRPRLPAKSRPLSPLLKKLKAAQPVSRTLLTLRKVTSASQHFPAAG